MVQNRDELKLLSQELKNPYQQLHLIFLLISIIPALSCVYILYGKLLVDQPLPPELVPILFFSNLIMLLGYVVGYQLIKSVLRKTLGYATRARLSEEQRSGMAVALAHDLKSPLAVIKANMANLKECLLGPLTLKQTEVAELVSQVTDRTAALLMDLIKTYSPQEGRSRSSLPVLICANLRKDSCARLRRSLRLKISSLRQCLPKTVCLWTRTAQ